MKSDILTLLKPRWWSFLNHGKATNQGLMKYITIGILGIGFWISCLVISLKVLKYFTRIEQLGDILAWKLLSMVIITIFSLLIFSSILNALSKLYLSRDLRLIHAMPVEAFRIFTARWIETTWTAPGWLFSILFRYLWPMD